MYREDSMFLYVRDNDTWRNILIYSDRHMLQSWTDRCFAASCFTESLIKHIISSHETELVSSVGFFSLGTNNLLSCSW